MTQTQKEFDDFPERTELGKKCIEYLTAKTELEAKKEKVDQIKRSLIDMFIKEGKKSLQIEGRIVTYMHSESDKIAVKE